VTPTSRRLRYAPLTLSRRATVLTLTACACMMLSAYHLRDFDDPYAMRRAVIAFLFGAAALMIARRLCPPAEDNADTTPRSPIAPVAALPAALGAALLAPLMIMNNDTLGAGVFDHVSPLVQFIMLVIGIALITWGLGGAPRLRLPIIERRELLVVLLITIVALVLRVWNLENSLRVFVDEILLSTGTVHFWGDHPVKLLQPIGLLMPFPRVFPLWISGAIMIFGRTLTGLRFASAILGTLTIPAVYFLARQFFDRRTALVGALLLATFPPFVHFSRIALINIADPLFGSLALAFTARAIRRSSRMDYALGGAMLGIGQYFYEGGKLLFPVLVVFWLCGLAVASVIASRREGIRLPFSISGMASAALATALIALPVFITTLTYTGDFKPRISDASLGPNFWRRLRETGDINPYVQRIDEPFLMVVRLPEEALYYGGNAPLILPVFVPLFLLGGVHVLARRKGGAWVFALWVFLTSMGNTLLVHSMIAARYVVVMPALALLMAVGLTETLRLLLPKRWAAAAATPSFLFMGRGRDILAAALAVIIAAVQVGYYFGPHLAAFNVQFRKGEPDAYDALFRSAHFPPGTGVHLIAAEPALTQSFADQMLSYLADDMHAYVVTPDKLSHAYMLRLSRSVDQAFFLAPTDTRSLALIEQYFPVDPQQDTPYDIPPGSGMTLYYYHAPPRGS
jgi:hypothetical protein